MRFPIFKKWFETEVSAFARTFPKYPFYTADEKSFYQMLEKLDHSTTLEDTRKLIDVLHSMSYSSNVSGYYQHFFPIVSHILYFKPEEENRLLHHLVGPIFATSITEPAEILKEMIASKDFQLQGNPHFLTKEGIAWVANVLPDMLSSVQREVEKCWKDLE